MSYQAQQHLKYLEPILWRLSRILRPSCSVLCDFDVRETRDAGSRQIPPAASTLAPLAATQQPSVTSSVAIVRRLVSSHAMASPTMIVPPAVVGQSSLDFDVDLLQVQQQVQATTPAGGANGTGVASLSLDPHSGMQSPVIERMASEGEMRREFEGQPPAASAPKRRLEEQSPPGHGAVYQPTNGHAYHASQPGVGFVSQHLSELDQFDDQQQQHQAKRQRTFDQHASDEHKYDTSTHHQQIAAAYPAHPASNSQSQSQSQGRTRRPRHGKHVGRRSSSESDHSSDSRPSSRGSNSSGTSSSSSDDDEDQEQQRARRGRAADQLRGDQPLAHEEADAGDLSHPVDDSGQALFTCQTAHVDTIVHLLTSLVLEKDQVVKASIGVMGIKIVAEQKGSLVCAKAYLKKEIFSTYEVNPARLTQARGLRVGGGGGFEYSLFISLPMLLSCLQLFGSGSDLGASAPVLDMQIAGENDPLELTCGHKTSRAMDRRRHLPFWRLNLFFLSAACSLPVQSHR